MKEIWRVPKNLCREPEKCEVVKETQKTFSVGGCVSGCVSDLVRKSVMATNFVCYFESEEEAWNYYNAGKEREKNNAIARDMMIKLAGKGKFMLKYALVSKMGEQLMSSSYEFEASSNSEAIKKAKEFIEQKNSYKDVDGNKCVQEKLYRLLPVEEME